MNAEEIEPEALEGRIRELETAGLSKREAQVRALSDAGESVAEIANRLGIAESTVYTYLDRVMNERNRARAILRTLENSDHIDLE